MRGIIIYEGPFMGFDYVRAVNLNNADYKFELRPSEDAEATLSGSYNKSAQAKCSKEDIYDFETGALIALMKMCGAKKVADACCEAFPHETSGSIYRENKRYIKRIKELEEENKRLKEKINDLYGLNKRSIDEIDQKNREIISLKRLKLSFKLSNESLKEENKTLKKEKEQIIAAKNVLYNKLEEENKKLKLDNEKLQHGYNAGLGRLVNINGVNYRECDEKGRVVWFTSQPERFSFNANYIDTDALEALRGSQKKPISKREQMWDDILKRGRTPVYVKREDIHDFLEECQVVGIKWLSGKSPLETIPFHMSVGHDGVYFFIHSAIGGHTMSWWCTACPDEVEAAIHYIRPMRWDLFKKGRIVVKVNKENHSEFCTEAFNHFTKVRISSFNHACKFGYFVFNKDTNYVERILVSDYDTYKEINHHKVVDWEDVR